MIDNPDIVNACFEFIGGCTQWANVRQLWQHKEVKGIVWWFPAFFISWGLYNLRFYSAVAAPYSWWGGLWMTCANIVWLSLALYYKRKTV